MKDSQAGAIIMLLEMLLHQGHVIARYSNPECPVCLREKKK